MGCLWFLPARRFEGGHVPEVLKGPDLDGLGLGHLDGARLTFRGVRNNGPDGGAGLVLALGVPASETGFFKDRQTWQPCAGGEVWIGWPRDGRPGPRVFERADLEPTKYGCVLGDGNWWGFTPTTALPQVLAYDSAGQLTTVPRDGDAAHYAASQFLFELLAAWAGESVENPALEEVTVLDIYEKVSVCLGARYHVSMMEAVALGLYRDDLWNKALLAALGVKKKQDEETDADGSGSSSSAGGGD